MAKKGKNNHQHQEPPKQSPTQLADRYTGVAQVLALVGVIALLIIRGFVQTVVVPDYVIIALVGVAVGLGPDQIGKILTDIIKSFIGKK